MAASTTKHDRKNQRVNMDSQREPSQNVSPFVLQTQQESSSFRSKTDDIFGSLGSLEQKYQTDLTKRKADDKKRGHDEDGDDSGEGCFKKPGLPSHSQERSDRLSRERRSEASSDRSRDHYRPSDGPGGRSSYHDYDSRRHNRETFSRPPRGRGRFHQPDYKMNPDKWTKYSLEDTCMYGDSFNRNVAMDFISELRKRKDDQNTLGDSGEPSGGCAKIEFHKPTSTQASDSEHDEQASGKRKNYGSVYRMPEYVIGSAKKSKSKHHTNRSEASGESSTSKSNLVLDHLADDDVNTDKSMDTATAESNQSPSSRDSKQQPPNQSAADKVDSSAESIIDQVAIPDTTEVEEQAGSDQGKSQFKFGKGKGKRKIRARQVEDD